MARRTVRWTRTADLQYVGILEYWVKRNKSKTYSTKLIKIVAERSKQIAEKPFLYKSADFEDTRVASLGNFSIFYKVTDEEIIITSCIEKKAPDQKGDISNFLLTDHIKLELNNDTVLENSYIKGIVTLTKPKFSSENSKIVVVIEDSLEILKSDLSNERETFIAIFTNLERDTINRKHFPKYDLLKTAAFGKKMKKEGSQKIRGYVMEYYGIELGPNYDITSDSLTDQRNKIYFEKEITVLPN